MDGWLDGSSNNKHRLLALPAALCPDVILLLHMFFPTMH